MLPRVRWRGRTSLPTYLGTFMYRYLFGSQLQLGDPHMGSAIASAMFGIILIGVCLYLFGIQRRMRSYQF